MAHSYTESISVARKTIIILAVVTIVEVLLALLGKGHLIEGFKFPIMIFGIIMIILSLFKAYLIIYEFMHMKYEDNTLVKTVLLPTLLLIWAIVAFVWEGTYWKNQRAKVGDNKIEQVIEDHQMDSHDTHHINGDETHNEEHH